MKQYQIDRIKNLMEAKNVTNQDSMDTKGSGTSVSTNGGSKLEGNILKSVCAAITTFFHNDANGICFLNPLTHAHDETW